MRIFKHSGKLGDLVYSLPTVRELGGGVLVLNPNRVFDFSLNAATSLLPLLKEQPYIEDARLWHGETVAIDLDGFRNCLGPYNLAMSHLIWCGLNVDAMLAPWLSVEPHPHRRPVFSRSLIRHGVSELWPLCRHLLPNAVFVGTKEEHAGFEQEFGEIEWHETQDLLQLTKFVAGGSVFVGNQSCLYAIAEGLKMRSVLEVDLYSPNCNFGRSDGIQITHPQDLLPLASVLRQWGIG